MNVNNNVFKNNFQHLLFKSNFTRKYVNLVRKLNYLKVSQNILSNLTKNILISPIKTHYCSYSDTSNKRVSKKGNFYFVNTMKKLLQLDNITKNEETIRNRIFEKCKTELVNFTDYQMFELLNCLVNLEKKFFEEVHCKAYSNLIKSIGDECIKRDKFWNIETFLDFFQKYRILSYSKIHSSFLVYAVKMNYRRVMNCNSLLPILKYIHIMNNPKSWRFYHNNGYELISVLNQYYQELTVNEKGSFLEALNYWEFNISDHDLKINLLNDLINNFYAADPPTVLLFMKFFAFQGRYSNQIPLTQSFIPLLQLLRDNSDRIELDSLCCCAVVCTQLLIYDAEFLNKISQKLLHYSNSSRLLHEVLVFTKSIYCLTYFNFHSNSADLYKELCNEMMKDTFYYNLRQCPKLLIFIVSCLSSIGIYPYALINEILSENFLLDTYGKLNEHCINVNILKIAYGLEIECPDYDGNRIPLSLLNKMMRHRCYKIPKYFQFSKDEFYSVLNEFDSNFFLSSYHKVIYEVNFKLISIFKSENFTHVCRLVPYATEVNLLLCLNSNNTLQELPVFIKNSTLVDRTLLNKNLRWLAICVTVCNPLFTNNRMTFGTEVRKIRQLRILGYEIINIIHDEWCQLNEKEKESHLENIIGYSLALQKNSAKIV